MGRYTQVKKGTRGVPANNATTFIEMSQKTIMMRQLTIRKKWLETRSLQVLILKTELLAGYKSIGICNSRKLLNKKMELELEKNKEKILQQQKSF